MAELSKARRVYTLEGVNRRTAEFVQEESDNPLFSILRQDWEDLGRPLELTVTIEPGNKLNA